MKAAQIPKPQADFSDHSAREPKPQRRQVRIKVEACAPAAATSSRKRHRPISIHGCQGTGILASSTNGPEGVEWKKGQRVGIGWHGGHDGTTRCRRGDFALPKS
jgi:D-arabinose 1-dehydrogenase-like Zn-dependent alcohol dehydrogenase